MNISTKTCLVIDCRVLSHLSMDGPALKVRVRQQSHRLFPLRRLSRIHVIGSRTLEQGFDALLTCAEKQIPVAFFTVQGKLRCQLYFPVYENSMLSHWLEHVEFDPQANEQYQQWLEHQRVHIIAMMGMRQGCREKRMDQVREILHAHCNNKLGRDSFHQAMAWLQGMMSAHVSQLIVEHGLSNQSRGKRRLMEDISPLCELWLNGALVEMLGSRKKLRIDGVGMSALYQSQTDRIDYMVRRMLIQLSTRLEAII